MTKLMVRMYTKTGSMRFDFKKNTLSVVFKGRQTGTVRLDVSDASKFANAIYPSIQNAIPTLVQMFQQRFDPTVYGGVINANDPGVIDPNFDPWKHAVRMEPPPKPRRRRAKKARPVQPPFTHGV